MHHYLCFWLLLLLAFASSCGVHHSENREEIVVLASDTATNNETNIFAENDFNTSTDELFIDFLYRFSTDSLFQQQSIDKEIAVEKKCNIYERWRKLHLYDESAVYVMLFSGQDSLATDDSSLQQISVERIDFNNHLVESYRFTKTAHHSWQLDSIETVALRLHPESSFYRFYHQFSAEKEFREKHLATSLRLRTYDLSTAEEMDGWISPAQATLYMPPLPQEQIVRLCVSPIVHSHPQRTLVVNDGENGSLTTLHFKAVKDSWMLQQIDN